MEKSIQVIRAGPLVAPGLSETTRREFLRRTTMAGLGFAALGISACATDTATTTSAALGTSAASSGRPLTPALYDWILALYPIDDVAADFPGPLDIQQAPVQGFGIERFIAEAANDESTWDIYLGMTPFIEMAALVQADILVPWEEYLPAGNADDWIESVRAEATYEGGIFSYPYDVSLVAQAWNADILKRADLDPEAAPATWDELLSNAQKIVDSEAAPFGVTFDANGWRSIVPVTHSISTDVYTDEGLFDFTHEATVEALEILRRVFELANPDVLDPGATDAGVNVTPDEAAWAAQDVGYIFKHQFGLINPSTRWTDPSQIRLAGLPKTAGGTGGTVFWSTGAGLFRVGENKQAAGEFMEFITHDERIQMADVGNTGSIVGQLPAYSSVWAEWEENTPDWLADWAFLLKDQLTRARAIETHPFGINQFFIGKPFWEEYLRGDEADPALALKRAKDAVDEEIAKA